MIHIVDWSVEKVVINVETSGVPVFSQKINHLVEIIFVRRSFTPDVTTEVWSVWSRTTVPLEDIVRSRSLHLLFYRRGK